MRQTLQTIDQHLRRADRADAADDRHRHRNGRNRRFKSDDYFYLPPEMIDNADFQKGLKLFLSPDEEAARLIITTM